MKPKDNTPSFLKSFTSLTTAFVSCLLLGTASAAPVTVVWDIENVDEPAATAPIGVTASTLAPISPVSHTSDSSRGGWRTRNYTGTDDYVQFSLSTDASSTLTLESLVFEAWARAAGSSDGSWIAPEITLEYATDAAFTTPVAAGTLDLGVDLPDGSDEGVKYTSDTTTFFSTDLVINPSETYYFRLRASNATGSNTGRNQIYYGNATDMTLNGDLVSSSTALVWTGSTDNDWNLTDTNWEGLSAPGVPVLFASDDDVTIDVTAAIVVDGGGITAGNTVVDTSAGEITLSGGALTTSSLTKTGDGLLTVNNSVNTGLAATILTNGHIVIQAGTWATSSLDIAGGETTELIINNTVVGAFTNSGATNLGTTGGRFRLNNGTSLSLGTVTASGGVPRFDKRGGGTFNLTGPVGSDGIPVDLHIQSGIVNFDGVNDVNVTGDPSDSQNSINSPITLNGTQFVLHGVNFVNGGGGSIESLASNTRIKGRFNRGANTINLPVMLTAGLIAEARAEGANGSSVVFAGPISGVGGLTTEGPGFVFLEAVNTYTGTTSVAAGTLIIDGDNSSATGAISVATDAVLGGNGASGGTVTLATGAGLTASISDWTGISGTGYDDLAVASLDAGSFPINLEIDTEGLVNFTETAADFTILNTTSGITNFVPSTVTISTPDFTGTGTWSIAESSGSLVLSYAPLIGSYSTWAVLNAPTGTADDDFDGDGVSNAVEFVLGGDKDTDDLDKLPNLDMGGANMLFTFNRDQNSTGASTAVSIEVSTDLGDWTETYVVPDEAVVADPGVTVVKDSPVAGTDTVTLSVVRAPDSKKFARLNVVIAE